MRTMGGCLKLKKIPLDIFNISLKLFNLVPVLYYFISNAVKISATVAKNQIIIFI